MRGLEEIKQINENPDAHFASREPQHFGESTKHSQEDALKSILEQITGGNPKAAADDTTKLIENLLASKKPTAKVQGEDILGLYAACAILDLLGVPAPTFSQPRTLADRPRQHAEGRRHLGMDGILSAIDAQPPFLTFWQKLNDDHAALGLEEAGYKEAKEAYNGGPTPNGSLTFIGKEWDGIRAVPSHPVQGRKSYHGEFRQTAANGSTVWRTVASQAGVIEYTTPEAAISGARHARIHSEAAANKS